MDINKIKEDTKKIMSKFRYEHSIRVAEEAKRLARHYHINEEKAYLCGLLHDVAREFSDKKIEEYVYKYNLNLDFLKKENIEIAHAEIGPFYITEKYNFISTDILEAIKYHTIGNKNMSTLDKILFLADKTGRKELNDEMLNIKKLSYENLDESLLAYLFYMQKKLESMNKRMHQDSLKLLQKLLESSSSNRIDIE